MARIYVSCAPRDLERSRGLWSWLQEQGHEGSFLGFDKEGEPETSEAEREQKLNETLGPSLALIAVVTPNWRESPWRQTEFEKAQTLRKPIFPIVIRQGDAPPDGAGLEEFDIFDNSPEQLMRLAAELSRLEQASGAEASGEPPPPAPEPEPEPQPQPQPQPEPSEDAAAAQAPAELARLKQACDEAEAKLARAAAAARRRRNALAAALVTLVAASAGLALVQRSLFKASKERDGAIANEVRLVAQSARRAVDSHDPVRGMLLSLEAFEGAGRNTPRPVTAAAETALYSALARNRETMVISNAAPIHMMAFSPDGRLVLMGHGEGALDPASGPAQIWNARTGAEVCTLRGAHGRGVASASFNPAGDRVVTVSQDGAARLWNAGDGSEIAALSGHEAKVTEAWFGPGGELAVTRHADASFRLWRGRTGEELASINGLGGLSSVAFSPDGSRLAVATREGAVMLWDSQTAARPRPLHGHGGPVVKAAFSPTGLRVVTASPDGTARIWSAETGAEIALLSQHRDQVRDAVFSPDGVEVLTVSADGEARIWDSAMGAPLAAFRGKPGEFDTVSFSPDGGRALTLSASGDVVKLWDVRAGEPVAQIEALTGGETGAKVNAEFSADGSRLLTVARPSTPEGAQRARLWNTADGSLLADLGEAVLAAFNPVEPQALTLSRRRGVQLWSAGAGKLQATLAGPEAQVETAAFHPSGAAVFALSGAAATVWDVRMGRPASTQTRQIFPPPAAGGAPPEKPGARTFTALTGGAARIGDAVSGKELAVLKGGDSPLQDLIVSPDGVRAVTVSSTGQGWLWRVGSGRQLAVLADAQQPGGLKARFSHDGALLISTFYDAGQGWTARLWNARTGDQQAELMGHEEELTSVGFNPGGTLAITASRDGTARIWDVKGGPARVVLKGHEGEISAAAFSPDGVLAVTAAADGTVRTWNPATGEQLAVIEAKPRPSGKEEETAPVEAAFSPDGGRLLTRAETVAGLFRETLWDARSGARLASFEETDAPGDRAVFSSDGAWLMTARRGLKTLWSARTGQRAARSFDRASQERANAAPPEAGPVPIGLAAMADGRRVSVRNARTGAELAILDPEADPDGEAFASSAVSAGGKAGEAALSPNGGLLVTASPGRNLLVWETKGGRLIAALEAPEGDYPRAPSFTPDGAHVFTSLGRSGGAVWRVFPAASAIVEEAKRTAPRCLTRNERRLAGFGPELPAWCAEQKRAPLQSNGSISAH